VFGVGGVDAVEGLPVPAHAANQDGIEAVASAGQPAAERGRLLHAALSAWSEDRIEGVPESWQVFGERVAQASARLAAYGAQNVLVLSSGGVISRMAQAALGLDDRGAVDLNLSLRNSGLCELHSRPYGLALGSWNALPHLHDKRELWTYY
jgi:broad specificity phosphatase PhoE